MNGPGLAQRLLVICVTVLVAALALQWATQILQEIWPTLAVVAGVVLVGYGVVVFVGWRRDRW